ncbi:DUF4240 domain-containing protein [Arenimonas sp.]|uniref:DUF4240 domain-containing protein n=1 Tax=Arenimonas sp. TaxID=1872635 RepID=UPI0035AEB424
MSDFAAPMNDDTFWRIIGLLDWDEEGDDEAVIEPAVDALAQMPVEAIAGFEETLARKLHALDTRAHAREIGEDAYTDDGDDFSVDTFLYARCCVVANGRELYETVLANPAGFPKDQDFEALLNVAATAHEQKTGEEPEFFDTSVSYETFSNEAGWPED